ncbi:MAG: hypothetical protein R2911_30555 [Caldilineaceae bacterium]
MISTLSQPSAGAEMVKVYNTDGAHDFAEALLAEALLHFIFSSPHPNPAA